MSKCNIAIIDEMDHVGLVMRVDAERFEEHNEDGDPIEYVLSEGEPVATFAMTLVAPFPLTHQGAMVRNI